MNLNELGITKEELLQLVASKLADQYAEMESLDSLARNLVTSRVDECVKTHLIEKVDAMLVAEMEKLLREEICPVNLWGEKTGTPTTIRAALAERARVFWDTKVNSEGKLNDGYGGKPRHEWLFMKVVNSEFEAAIKQNLVNMTGAFKDALKANAKADVDKILNELIRVKAHSD